MYRRLWGLSLYSEDCKVVLTAVYHWMHKSKCLLPNIVIFGGSCGGQTHAVNCQSSVASMSHGITACDFGGKAISSATFTRTKYLTWGIDVNWLYKQLPGFTIFIISLSWGKIAFFPHCHAKVTWTGCVCLRSILRWKILSATVPFRGWPTEILST